MTVSARVHHVQGTLSDHCPLWVCSDDENARFYNKSRPFRFEAVWLRDENCEGIIKSAWNGRNSGDSVDRLLGKVEDCKVRLKSWSRLSFGNIRRLLTQKKKELVHAENLSMAGTNHDHVRILRGEVYELMIKEECLWQQRSRVEWLKSGDLNTSYFHGRATQRNKRNFISKLILDDGSVVEETKQIGDSFVDYFKNIFSSSTPSNFNQILQAQNAPRLAEIFAYVAWGIWHNRNAQRMGETTVPLGKIYTDAVERFNEFHAAQDIPVQQRPADHPTHWLPPSPTQYKANSYGNTSFSSLQLARNTMSALSIMGERIESLNRVAQDGDIEAFYSLIWEDVKILEDIDALPFVDTPLHITASADLMAPYASNLL
nr:hypothetical protein CFP56_42012 [Quercus suber]